MKRNLYSALESHLAKREFSILTGARQVGKSTLMKQLYDSLKTRGIPVVFINLERLDVRNMLDTDPLNLLQFMPNTEQKTIVFIDEVEYLSNPTNFLKLLYDEYADRVKIIATGSSAFYMDDKFTDSLAGRKKLFQMPTCSFDEYLQLKELYDLLADYHRIRQISGAKSLLLKELEIAFKDYVRFGGYPAVITESSTQDKIGRLQDLKDSFVKKDMDESKINNEDTFYNLFRVLAAQSGNLLNVNELSKTLHTQSVTLLKYLTVLQKCYHIALVKPFSNNLRKELIKMPKVYLMDTGMRNCLLNNFQTFDWALDQGIQWENTVFRMLLDRYPLEDIKFWRTTDGHEVDFVLSRLENPFALEVKTNENAVSTSKYKSFTTQYPDIPLNFAIIKPFTENLFRI